MFKKLKDFLRDEALFTTLLVILVGLVSFGLGRQSVSGSAVGPANNNQAGIVFNGATDFNDNAADENSAEARPVVASKSGSKYHLPDCPSVSHINEENKIYFGSIREAKTAGYEAAANCDGI